MQSLKSSILSKDSAHANTIWIHAIELAMQSKYNDERKKDPFCWQLGAFDCFIFASRFVGAFALLIFFAVVVHCCEWIVWLCVCVCEGIAISGKILQLTDLSNFQFKQIPCYFLNKIISSFQLVVIVLNRLHSNFSVHSSHCGLFLSFFANKWFAIYHFNCINFNAKPIGNCLVIDIINCTEIIVFHHADPTIMCGLYRFFQLIHYENVADFYHVIFEQLHFRLINWK